mmetsp:Transcript_1103/g.2924  ORF Transcript_1103/g.2924 Transcript_1103/m.2924 type:complete len:131 (+) Transcript_1103:190-582(+)
MLGLRRAYMMVSTMSLPRRGLDEFFDTAMMAEKPPEKVQHGKAWKAAELRLKSYDDLHKLWYVLLKERNLLLTERELCRRRGVQWPSPERLRKVQQGFARIRTVVHERKLVRNQLVRDFKKNTTVVVAEK